MAQGDNKHIFPHNPHVYGGTEYMVKNFHTNVLDDLSKLENYNCIVLPGAPLPLSVYLGNEKQFIVWIHNTPNQFVEHVRVLLNNPVFLERLKYIITPSEFAKKKVAEQSNIPEDKIYVIPNAIYPVNSDLSRFSNPHKIRLVNTSSFDRGTPLLMDALDFVKKDFRVDIYNDFYPDVNLQFPVDERVFFYGKTPKKSVIDGVAQAHIFAYPTVFEETFCLSLIEAMSAGLMPIYPDYGALKEVSGGRGIVYDYNEDPISQINTFSEKLEQGLDMISSGDWDPAEQIEFVNEKYSWDSIKKHWIDFEELI